MVTQETTVDSLYKEFQELVLYLEKQGEASFRSVAEEHFRKALLLTSASYFERRISDDILALARQHSGGNELVAEFIKNKAISRQFHTFFNWNAHNATQFFGLFGESFATFMINEVKSSTPLDTGIKAFLEIGLERNRMVHEDFGAYTLEKTVEEVYGLYKSAQVFVDLVPTKLREYAERNSNLPEVAR